MEMYLKDFHGFPYTSATHRNVSVASDAVATGDIYTHSVFRGRQGQQLIASPPDLLPVCSS